MGVLLISLAIGAVLGGITWAALGPVEAILPMLGGFGLAYFFLGRQVGKALESQLVLAQAEMTKGQNHIPRAIELLKQAKAKFGKLQFFAASSIDGQIGMVLFMQQKFKEARPHLENAFVRLWQAKVMLAVLDFKKKDMAAVDANLERTQKYAGKQGLLWSTWAWMHAKSGNRDKAIDILNRGNEVLKEGDETLKNNLLALKNGNKMKMKPYGDSWYQFGLEVHPMMKKAQRGGVRFARR
jgi:tetratricopeptide (TPR) repeat protein